MTDSVTIRVQPRASRTEVAGRHGTAIRIRVAAAPVDGEANIALVRFLAKALGVPRSAVRILTGQTGRTKRIAVTGLDGATITSRLLGHLPLT